MESKHITLLGADGMLLIFCPGCKCGHGVWTDPAHPNPITKALWKWNGNRERPTFEPSILVSPDDARRRCHSFVRNGQIQFLSDCHHALAGQTVSLPAF